MWLKEVLLSQCIDNPSFSLHKFPFSVTFYLSLTISHVRSFFFNHSHFHFIVSLIFVFYLAFSFSLYLSCLCMSTPSYGVHDWD